MDNGCLLSKVRGHKSLLLTAFLAVIATDLPDRFRIAPSKDAMARPREIRNYVGIFRVIVLQVIPEIELEIVKRLADAKR